MSPPVKPLNFRNFFYMEMQAWLLSLDNSRLQELLLYDRQSPSASADPASAASPSPTTIIDSCSACRICAAFMAEDDSSLSQEDRKARLWSRKQSKLPRKHRRVHRKLPFDQINALIDMGWKSLSESDKGLYRDVATVDRERYEIQSAEFEEI